MMFCLTTSSRHSRSMCARSSNSVKFWVLRLIRVSTAALSVPKDGDFVFVNVFASAVGVDSWMVVNKGDFVVTVVVKGAFVVGIAASEAVVVDVTALGFWRPFGRGGATGCFLLSAASIRITGTGFWASDDPSSSFVDSISLSLLSLPRNCGSIIASRLLFSFKNP